jgi:hypothetical protein
LVVRFQVRWLPALHYLEQGRCRFASRNGNIFNRFEILGGQVASGLEVDEAVIDGEAIAADETGRPQFCDLLRGARAPAYVAFDILWLDGVDLRHIASFPDGFADRVRDLTSSKFWAGARPQRSMDGRGAAAKSNVRKTPPVRVAPAR